MKKIMKKKNEWDKMVETDIVEGSEKKVAFNEIVKAMQKMKSERAAGSFEVSAEMIVARGKI